MAFRSVSTKHAAGVSAWIPKRAGTSGSTAGPDYSRKVRDLSFKITPADVHAQCEEVTADQNPAGEEDFRSALRADRA